MVCAGPSKRVLTVAGCCSSDVFAIMPPIVLFLLHALCTATLCITATLSTPLIKPLVASRNVGIVFNSMLSQQISTSTVRLIGARICTSPLSTCIHSYAAPVSPAEWDAQAATRLDTLLPSLRNLQKNLSPHHILCRSHHDNSPHYTPLPSQHIYMLARRNTSPHLENAPSRT